MLRSTAALLAMGLVALAAAQSKTDLAATVAQRLDLFCSRSRPDFNECMAARIEKLLPELAETGIPEVGIPRSEPFIVPEMNINYQNGNLSADLRIRDSKTWGVQGLRILGVRSVVNDADIFRFEVDFLQPRIFTEGYYKVDARLVIPLVTKGYYNITMTDVTGTWNVTGEHYQKRGRDHVRITSFNMLPEVSDMHVYASNLIPGNPELSDYVLSVSNQFWRLIYEQLLPDTNAAWSPIVRERVNRVFAKVPFDVLFPQ